MSGTNIRGCSSSGGSRPETICPPEGELATDAIERICKVLRKPLKKRDCFAIVASEPLATLIGWVVSDRKSELPDPCTSCGDQPRVQVFHCGTELSEHPFGSPPEMETVEARSPVPAPSANGSHDPAREENGQPRRDAP